MLCKERVLEEIERLPESRRALKYSQDPEAAMTTTAIPREEV
jgi:hypothetical protein